MDLSRLISQLTNMFLRRAMNKGINEGIKYASRRGKTPDEMTPAEREQARKAQDLAKRARQVSKITRRLGR
jgi:hypothetical protein